MRSPPIHSCRWRGPRRFFACPIPPRGRWFGCSRRKAFCGRSPAVPGVGSISLGRSCSRSRAREESSVARGAPRNGNGKRLATQQSVNAAVKAICDIMRRSNCAGALQYVPELTWILFLRILDEREAREADRARPVAADFTRSLEPPYRWREWAAPGGPERQELQAGTVGAVLSFVNAELLPYLRDLRDKPGAAPQQKVISEIMSGVERTRIDTDRNFL